MAGKSEISLVKRSSSSMEEGGVMIPVEEGKEDDDLRLLFSSLFDSILSLSALSSL